MGNDQASIDNPLPATSAHLRIYADLNCPFCYALHQRFDALAQWDNVDWCLIEHAQDIVEQDDSLQEQAILATEVFNVRHRAPDVTIAMPPARPNTHKATLIITEVQLRNPSLANRIRSAFYQALWVEGRNLADDQVIKEICQACQMDHPPAISRASSEKLEQQQIDWQQGDFDRRIPSLDFGSDKRLLGLPTPQELQTFLTGQDMPLDLETACAYRPRQQLMVLGDIKTHWHLFEALRHHKDIHLAQSAEQIINTLGDPEQPDLLILQQDFGDSETLALCKTIREKFDGLALPVIVIMEKTNDRLEAALFNAGVDEIVLSSKPSDIFHLRVDRLLRVQSTISQLRKTARTDHLTNVFSRSEFEWSLEVEWRRAQRGRGHLALIMIDIDYFKHYNDNHGHLAGDDILRQIAQTLKKGCQRASDFVARYGGEEFAIILPNTDTQGAEQIAEQLRQDVEALKIPHQVADSGSHPKIITVSIGIAVISPNDDSAPNDLIDQADKALYQAKAQGRNCTVIADQRLIQQH